MRDGLVIPLKSYRFVRRSWLRLNGSELFVRAPGWWGGKEWSVPVGWVGVVDQAFEPDAEDDTVYEEPVIVPYVVTTSPVTPPNLGLVFAEPVRVPQLRWLVRGNLGGEVPKRPARAGRPPGRYVDGLMLRAADPLVAAEQLVAAGAQRVADPEAWMRERRPLVTDPGEREKVEAGVRAFVVAERVLIGLGVVGLAVGLAGDRIAPWAEPGGGIVALAALVTWQLTAWWSQRWAFRRRRG